MNVEWQSVPEPLFVWAEDGSTLTTLQWEKKRAPFILEWVGPDSIASFALNDLTTTKSIAAVFGPPGNQGVQGLEGPRGQPGQDGDAIIPPILDGGNF